jgi:hypothetical protein
MAAEALGGRLLGEIETGKLEDVSFLSFDVPQLGPVPQ